jgi:hypothetical protein
MAAENDASAGGKVPEAGEGDVAGAPGQGDEADFVYDEAVMGRPLRISGVKLVGGHPILSVCSYVPLIALHGFFFFSPSQNKGFTSQGHADSGRAVKRVVLCV